MSKAKKQGFTLVEVLIVVVIMAILAATIIPQFSDSTKDAKNIEAFVNLFGGCHGGDDRKFKVVDAAVAFDELMGHTGR